MINLEKGSILREYNGTFNPADRFDDLMLELHLETGPQTLLYGTTFGHRLDERGEKQPSSVDKRNAAFITTYFSRFSTLQTLISSDLAVALRQEGIEPTIDLGIDSLGTATSYARGNPRLTGTEAEVDVVEYYMENENYERAILIGHPRHIPRVSALMGKRGIDTVMPIGLSHDYDEQSAQWWTRGGVRWAACEIPKLGLTAIKDIVSQ